MSFESVAQASLPVDAARSATIFHLAVSK